VDHAEQSPDWEIAADFEPWLQLIPGPAVHPDLAALPALASPNQHGAARAVKVRFGEIQRLADPERHSITIRAHSRAPSGPSPAARMTATISSIVGGSAG
jgi:hypothetical protein